tara:strand:+ start:584 stop:1111 length:528 start_codon:yes stop_codon:yes gene_type:complete
MSTLHVENLKGPTTGANANKIIVPSGQTLVAPEAVVKRSRVFLNNAESTTSTSFTDAAGGSINFACDFSDSTVYVYVQIMASGKGSVRIMADATDITNVTSSFMWYSSASQTSAFSGSPRQIASWIEIHEPSSTSSITYKLQYRSHSNNNANAFGINELFANSNWSYIECVEIKA